VGKTVADITMSLDGFVAGPNPTLEEPLGENGEQLHEWAIETQSWRERHGVEGGESNVDSEVIEEAFSSIGAHVMGRRCSAADPGPGRTTRGHTVGGLTSRPSTRRSTS
jgi:hypothetical protein